MIFSYLPVLTAVFVTIVSATITDDLLAGAFSGVFAGAFAGAMILPPMKAPDVAGRGVFFGIMLAIGVALFQLVVYILPKTEGSIFAFVQGSSSLGQAVLQAGMYTVIGLMAGFIIGMLTTVPGEVVKGAIVGIFLGGIAGAALNALIQYYKFNLDPLLFQFLVGLIVWGLFLSISGGATDERIPNRGKKKKKRR